MGQCHSCRRAREDVGDPREREAVPHSGSDSALDSSHSGGEDASYLGEGIRRARSGRSSQSSGKYSLRDSVGSCGECERQERPPEKAREVHPVPGFRSVQDEEDSDGDSRDSLQPLQDISKRSAFPGGSCDSVRGSVSPVSPAAKDLKERLGRSTSLKFRFASDNSAEVLNSWSWSGLTSQRRSASLRLPRRPKRPRDLGANLPTIYVENPEETQRRYREQQELSRKTSLKRALSLLSVNSLSRDRQDVSMSQRSQKPVQKILRQPRRRHNTVRGMSGMAIDRANQASVQHAGACYYPTRNNVRFSPRADDGFAY